MKQTFLITGMSCAACSAAVERSVRSLKGVKEARVNLLLNTLSVQFEEDAVSERDIISAVIRAGYGASVMQDSAAPAKKDLSPTKKRLILSFILLIPLMYISMGAMFGLPLAKALSPVLNGCLQALFTLAIVGLNFRYFLSGFKSLFKGSPNMDSLVAIGSGAALLYSLYSLAGILLAAKEGDYGHAEHLSHSLYFESAAVILSVVSLGKFLEERAKSRTSKAIEKLIDLAPQTAEVIRGGKNQNIPVFQLKQGDLIVIRSGQRLPADGIIDKGEGFMDESFVTGESVPVHKKAGDKVICATINTDGYFIFKAEKVGDNTTLAQIIKLMRDVNASKPPIAELADKISSVFVPAVIAIALISAVIWLLAGYSFPFALNCAVAVLVISCPCALGLATPTAIMCATGSGAKNGVLIKNAKSIQTGIKIDCIVLDKTGTLTQGKPAVTDIVAKDKDILLSAAAGIEALSSHPLAKAITDYAKQNNITPFKAENFSYGEGFGVKALCQGKETLAGNLKLMDKESVDVSEFKQKALTLSEQGKTVLFFAQDKTALGLIALADQIKPDAKEALKAFREMGLEVYMLTGDNELTASALAKELGIENFKAEVLPADKENFVRDLQKQGKTAAMIGDGINDAPALARADLAIAIGAGSDIAVESADIVLMHDKLSDAAYALKLSRAAITNIKQNLFWALFYNAAGIPLAAGVFYKALGWQLNPMFAASAMALSSVCVVLNSLRLVNFNPVKNKEICMKKIIHIEGMACQHCAGRVKTALAALGIDAEIDLNAKTATAQIPQNISDQDIIRALENAGYKVTGIK